MRHVSHRVPGKNFRPFAGVPLYRHVVATLLQVPEITEVIIDTDSPRITEDVAKTYPNRVRVLPRPAHLQADNIPMNDVLLHTIDQVGAPLYVQTHSTNPLLRPETVSRALAAFFAAPNRDSLFSVTRLQTRLWREGPEPMNHDPAVLLRTQDLPPVYEENSNLYIFTADVLRARGNRIGAAPLLFEIPANEAWDIDEELDFEIAEFLYNRRAGALTVPEIQMAAGLGHE
jgi:CMP-N-acetylneuraminic acid synthetase